MKLEITKKVQELNEGVVDIVLSIQCSIKSNDVLNEYYNELDNVLVKLNEKMAKESTSILLLYYFEALKICSELHALHAINETSYFNLYLLKHIFVDLIIQYEYCNERN